MDKGISLPPDNDEVLPRPGVMNGAVVGTVKVF